MDIYEQSREKLEKLKLDFDCTEKKSLNEANTRFKFIDRLLMECLAWNRSDISCEDSYQNKYTDYTLSLFRSVAVVEAKKTGDYFELPVGNKNLIQPIKSIYKDNANLKSAIDQVKGYCNDRGIQVAIVSNGWQFVAFVANRNDSVPPIEGKALVVPSLNSFLENFKEVWNCLSKNGFEEEYLVKKLIGKIEIELPSKLSASIHQYPGIKNRNPFQVDLEIISDLVLEDVIKEKDLEKDFLQNCYCKSGALSNYSLVSKEILSTRYDYLFAEGDKKSILKQVTTQKGLSDELTDLFSNSISKRPILLLGDVGVGKSTFIDYLRLVEASNVFEKAISFKIDLGSKAIISYDIKKAIINLIKNQLYEDNGIDIEDDDFVRHCYYVELEKFKKSVKVKRLYDIDPERAIEKEIEFLTKKVEDEVEHLKKSLEYVAKNRQKQLIVFIDNCDQRSDADQESAFLISQELSSNWPVIVFVSLRPETFHRTKKEAGALSGYHTKAFTIPPPRLDEVVRKRLEFAQKITSGEISLSTLTAPANFSKLHQLIDVFLYSLDTNKELLRFLNSTSNENIRKAIEIIKKFFGSGHVDMEKILEIYNNSGKYLVPLHELLRSVIFSDNIHYSPTNTEIINVFDIRHFNPNDHFILLLLIALLDDYSKNSRNSGFVSITETYSYLQGLGFTPPQIDSVLNFAYAKKMFEISQKGDKLDTEIQELQIRATNLAIYHLHYLIKSFAYIDAIIVDTPIINNEFKSKITNTMSIKTRIDRAIIFKEYLDQQWKAANISSNYFDWQVFSTELQNEFKKISKRIDHEIT